MSVNAWGKIHIKSKNNKTILRKRDKNGKKIERERDRERDKQTEKHT